jgi:hypothetical protein
VLTESPPDIAERLTTFHRTQNSLLYSTDKPGRRGSRRRGPSGNIIRPRVWSRLGAERITSEGRQQDTVEVIIAVIEAEFAFLEEERKAGRRHAVELG